MTKKTRYFLAGSAAVLAAGLGTGLVALLRGRFRAAFGLAGPNELRYVPADATVVAYADVRGDHGLRAAARLKEAMPMHEQGQREFQEQTGIDIERDIDYVVARRLSTGARQSPHRLVVARGRFNDTQLEGLAREHGGAVEEYKGKRLIMSARRNGHDDAGTDAVTGSMTLAFLEPGLVAIGDATAVKNVDRRAADAHSITSNNEMMELVGDIGQGNNAWAVGRFDVLAAQANLPEQVSSRLPPVKWFAAAGHVNGGVVGQRCAPKRATTRRPRTCATSSAASSRSPACRPRPIRASQRLVESLQLTGTGKTVALSFTVPQEIAPDDPEGERAARAQPVNG